MGTLGNQGDAFLEIILKDRLEFFSIFLEGFGKELDRKLIEIEGRVQRLQVSLPSNTQTKAGLQEDLQKMRGHINYLKYLTESFSEDRHQSIFIYDYVQWIAALLGDRMTKSGIALQNDVDRKARWNVHLGFLTQVVLAIAINSIEAMETSTKKDLEHPQTLMFISGVKDEKSFLRISDTGPGMTTDVLQRCWEIDYSTKGHRGTGLGLSLARFLSDRMGVDLHILSAPQMGTEIDLVFPA